MKKIFLSVLLLFIIKSCALADCFTGAACSISDLEETYYLKSNEFTKYIHKYFDKTVNENLFFGQNNSVLNYNELFIFNTIV